MRAPDRDELPVSASPTGAPARLTVTVAICTHNRSADVGHCCAALAPHVRRMGFAFLIIDSCSNPLEAKALRRLAAHFGACYLRAEKPGLSSARNLACAESQSAWIAFLDDDTIPRPDWGEALCAALNRASPEVAMVGGRTVPLWPEGARSDHVTARWKLLLSCVDEDGRGPVSAGQNICGANLTVRRDAVALAGGFPPELGRIGSNLLGGEESFLIERLSELGESAVYDGSVAVWHRVSKERLTREWVAKRAFWEGASQVGMMRALGRDMPRWLRPPKLALSLPFLSLLRLMSSDPDATIRYHMALGAYLAQSPKGLKETRLSP